MVFTGTDKQNFEVFSNETWFSSFSVFFSFLFLNL